jgi:hypothetical protein
MSAIASETVRRVQQELAADEAKRAKADATKNSDVRHRGAIPGLVFKTRGDARIADAKPEAEVPDIEDSDDQASLSADAAFYATAKTPSANPYPWWTWVDKNLEYRQNFMRDVIGMLVASERRSMREHCAGEVGVVRRELEQHRRETAVLLREQVLECGRALREEREQLDVATRRELELSKRELALLQKEIGLERGLRALHEEVATARADIPRLPDIEARVDAKQTSLEAEVTRLRSELATTKDKLATLRAQHSQTQYGLDQLEREQSKKVAPEIEIRLETANTHFVMRDIDPNAMEAWRQFVAGMLEAQQDVETTLSVARPGQVISMPVRGKGNAA